MSFGVAGAVACFYRWPRFAVAVSRRVLQTLMAMYFDDSRTQGLASAKGSAQRAIADLMSCLGTRFAPTKRQTTAAQAGVLG